MSKKDTSRERVEAAFDLREEPQRIKAYYGKWAESYDQDVNRENYVGPHCIASLVKRYTDKPEFENLRCLDAGCGTGLVGIEMSKLGFTDITGSDISPQMAQIAEKAGPYKNTYAPVDLTNPLAPQIGEDNFDISVCCGVFTLGHVPPDALLRLYDITAPSGLIALSARSEYCAKTDFKRYIADFVSKTSSLLLYCETAPYVGEDTALYTVIKTT